MLRHRWILAVVAALLLAVAGAGVAGYSWVSPLVKAAPAADRLALVQQEQPSVVLASDGVVLATFRRTHREWVPLSGISPHVVDALIATEDQRFYQHHGIDWRRTLSAAMHTMRGDLQGGSTITQQLARNLFPEEIGRAPTLSRKVKEAATALRIERAYGKPQILEAYLNTVPFLYNTYGIEMAARTYFGKSAADLDVLQSATLIGMLKGTTFYNPVLNPERSRDRRNLVLAQMVRAGKLDAAAYDSLKQQPLALDFDPQDDDAGPAPHVTQQLRAWLTEWADRTGHNMYVDGLVVQTTIDSKLQAMATEAVKRQADKLQLSADKAWRKGGWAAHKALAETFLKETGAYRQAVERGTPAADALRKLESDSAFMDALWKDKTRLESGFVAIEPGTGRIRAWVGSRDFEHDKFDHVGQARRQPGSTFKPFVYGAAFEMGMSPAMTFIDQAPQIDLGDGRTWTPGDVEASSGLPMSLRDGLVHSKNSITSQLVQQVGASRVAQLARALGVRQSKLDAVPSLALGTSPVTLKEMVTSFASIANGGNYVEPVLVARVEDRSGRVLEAFDSRSAEPGLAKEADQVLLDAMRGVVDEGTGAGIRSRFGLRGDLAGKTGTTQSNTDGWFILMHPQLVGGAWVGFNDNRVTMTGSAWGQGARNALNVVGDFFQQAVKARAVDATAKFPVPRGLATPPPPVEMAPIPILDAQGPSQMPVPMPLAMSAPMSAPMSTPMPAVVAPAPATPVLVVPHNGAGVAGLYRVVPSEPAPRQEPTIVVPVLR